MMCRLANAQRMERRLLWHVGVLTFIGSRPDVLLLTVIQGGMRAARRGVAACLAVGPMTAKVMMFRRVPSQPYGGRS